MGYKCMCTDWTEIYREHVLYVEITEVANYCLGILGNIKDTDEQHFVFKYLLANGYVFNFVCKWPQNNSSGPPPSTTAWFQICYGAHCKLPS